MKYFKGTNKRRRKTSTSQSSVHDGNSLMTGESTLGSVNSSTVNSSTTVNSPASSSAGSFRGQKRPNTSPLTTSSQYFRSPKRPKHKRAAKYQRNETESSVNVEQDEDKEYSTSDNNEVVLRSTCTKKRTGSRARIKSAENVKGLDRVQVPMEQVDNAAVKRVKQTGKSQRSKSESTHDESEYRGATTDTLHVGESSQGTKKGRKLEKSQRSTSESGLMRGKRKDEVSDKADVDSSIDASRNDGQKLKIGRKRQATEVADLNGQEISDDDNFSMGSNKKKRKEKGTIAVRTSNLKVMQAKTIRDIQNDFESSVEAPTAGKVAKKQSTAKSKQKKSVSMSAKRGKRASKSTSKHSKQQQDEKVSSTESEDSSQYSEGKEPDTGQSKHVSSSMSTQSCPDSDSALDSMAHDQETDAENSNVRSRKRRKQSSDHSSGGSVSLEQDSPGGRVTDRQFLQQQVKLLRKPFELEECKELANQGTKRHQQKHIPQETVRKVLMKLNNNIEDELLRNLNRQAQRIVLQQISEIRLERSMEKRKLQSDSDEGQPSTTSSRLDMLRKKLKESRQKLDSFKALTDMCTRIELMAEQLNKKPLVKEVRHTNKLVNLITEKLQKQEIEPRTIAQAKWLGGSKTSLSHKEIVDKLFNT